MNQEFNDNSLSDELKPIQIGKAYRRENIKNGVTNEIFKGNITNNVSLAVPKLLSELECDIYEMSNGLNKISDIALLLRKKYNVGSEEVNKDLKRILKIFYKKGFINFDVNPKKARIIPREPEIELKQTRNLLRSPMVVNWSITNRCNLRCKHCYVNFDQIITEKEVNEVEASRILSDLIENRVFYINFLGGEPLLRNDIFELGREAMRNGVWTCLTTNGTLINQMDSEKFKRSFDVIQISLDGTEKIHNEIRGINVYKKVIKNIKYLLNNDINLRVSYTMTKVNMPLFNKFVNSMIEIGVKEIFLNRFYPVGNATKNNLVFNYKAKGWLEVFKWLYPYIEKIKNKIKIVPPPHFNLNSIIFGKSLISGSYQKLLENYDSQVRRKKCYGGNSKIGIAPNGDVLVCDLLPWNYEGNRFGNLLKEKFKVIWLNSNSDLLSQFRNGFIIEGICRECKLRPICLSGCRAYIYGRTDNIKESDPDCIFIEYIKGNYNYIKK